MSAAATMAGLFPPNRNEWRPNKDINWRPIPIHSSTSQKKCPRYEYEMVKVVNGNTYKAKLEESKELINYLAFHSKVELKTFMPILDLYDTLSIEKLKGKRYVVSNNINY